MPQQMVKQEGDAKSNPEQLGQQSMMVKIFLINLIILFN